MGIPIEQRFVINAARPDVWAFLTDPSRVAGCLPGAAITEQVDERTHSGTIAVKVGPISARYKGKVRFERLDEEEGVAEIAAAGQDVRGKGGADLRMTSRVAARGPSETEVTVASTVNVTGILAQFGRGMIQDLSDQMFRQFTDAMRAALEPPPAAGADRPVDDRPVAASPAADSAGAPRPTADPSGAQAPAAGAPGGDAIDAVSLGATVGRRALGRALRRPGLWLAVVIVAAILWLLVD
ncbi:MAG: SRPBCC family protein [Acidobacteria bacterium]|nr:SRPBCC family protein [Acidobacteriota bacterium]